MAAWTQRVERYPALGALLAQLLATALVAGLVVAALQLAGWRFSPLGAGLLQGAVAAWLVRRMGLSAWWWGLSLVFMPAVLLVNGAALPSWVFLAGFVLLLLLNWNSVSERVPLYLTGARSTEALATWLAQRAPRFRFIDLGCGPAGALLRLARRFPQAQFVGVETAPLSFAIAWLRSLGQANCRIRYASLWRTDLAHFDVAYCFLSPAPMAALWRKACAELPAGAWLISNSFEVPDVPADETLALPDWRQSRLMLWRIIR